MNLIDIKVYTKKRPVKMDLFSAILFAFQVCLRLFLLAKKPQLLRREVRESQYSWKDKSTWEILNNDI